MKEIWIVVGFLSLILGLIGIVLPILPTTPFLILTAYGFSKGNEKVHNWFLNSKVGTKFSLKMEMSISKKIILNLLVDTVLVVYMILYKSFLMTSILLIVIIVKHFIFHKYVKTI